MASFESKEPGNISWARYDEATHVLEIDFKDSSGVRSSTYRYEGFSPEAWLDFRSAESKGRYFAFKIRPRFKGTKIPKEAK
jgi:hypothetical protein